MLKKVACTAPSSKRRPFQLWLRVRATHGVGLSGGWVSQCDQFQAGNSMMLTSKSIQVAFFYTV